MLFKAKTCKIKNIGFYQQEKSPKTWHKYADIMIPLITIPLLVFIALCLNDYITSNHILRPDAPEKWEICVLSVGLLVISLAVFIYMCIRLNAILGGRSRVRVPMIRSAKSEASFLRSINSDLQYKTPFNNYPATYESIIFDVPPYHHECQNTSKKVVISV